MDKKEFLQFVSKESGVPVEEIAGVYTDEERGERMIFKRNQIINQLQRIGPKINDSFDKIYSEEFNNISSNLSEILPLLYIGHKHVLIDKDEVQTICGDLLRNASNTVISSVQTLRCGFRLQSGILLRSVIEMCATVVHLILEPKSLDDFKKDTHKSTNSISVANRKIPIFGKAWGILSNKQIHINSLHADWYPLEEYTDKEDISAEVTLGIIRMTILILRITTELTFFRHIDDHVYWKSVDENSISFIPPDDDNIGWIKDKLKKE